MKKRRFKREKFFMNIYFFLDIKIKLKLFFFYLKKCIMMKKLITPQDLRHL